MLMKKMVEYLNEPPASCTVCQPLSRKSSTHQYDQCLVMKYITCLWSLQLFNLVTTFTSSGCWLSFSINMLRHLDSLRVDALSRCLMSFCIVYNVPIACHLTWETHKAGEAPLEWKVAGVLHFLQCSLVSLLGNTQRCGGATWVKRRERNVIFCGLGCISPESCESFKCG